MGKPPNRGYGLMKTILALLIIVCASQSILVYAQHSVRYTHEPIVKDPVGHYLRNNVLDEQGEVYTYLVDLNQDGQRDLLISSSGMMNGRLGLDWEYYLKQRDGSYRTSDDLKDGYERSLIFNPTFFSFGPWGEHERSMLITYFRGNARSGSLVGYLFDGLGAKYIVLEKEISLRDNESVKDILVDYPKEFPVQTTGTLGLARTRALNFHKAANDPGSSEFPKIVRAVPKTDSSFTTVSITTGEMIDWARSNAEPQADADKPGNP